MEAKPHGPYIQAVRPYIQVQDHVKYNPGGFAKCGPYKQVVLIYTWSLDLVQLYVQWSLYFKTTHGA